jgi:hypothetical protein
MRVFADKFTTVEDKNWFEDESNVTLEKPAASASAKGEKKGVFIIIIIIIYFYFLFSHFISSGVEARKYVFAVKYSYLTPLTFHHA